MKILVYEKYKPAFDSNRIIERYIVFYGKDEGEYYMNDYYTNKKGIRAKLNNIENGKTTYYGDYCCTNALTKHDVIRDILGGNGYVDGYIPNIIIKDLETGHVFDASEYMKTNNITKFDGGWDNAEKYFKYMYKI